MTAIQLTNYDDEPDPKEQLFTAEDEKQYVRKIDTRILPLLLAVYTVLQYDKHILGHAAIFDLIEDLGLYTISEDGTKNTKRYSDVSMIFYVGFAVSSYPMLMTVQRFRPSRAIAGLMTAWGVVTLATPSCTGYASMMVCRCLLGVFESAVSPLMNTYMTYWWSRREQSLRASIWYSAMGISMMISPLIDYGMGSIHGKVSGWCYMFYFAGSMTIVMAAIVAIFLPDSADEWSKLTPSQLAVNQARVAQNLQLEVKTSIQKDQILEVFTSYTTYVASLIAFCGGIAGVTMLNFQTLIVKSFGVSTFATLALGIPTGALYTICMVTAGYVNLRFKNKLFLTCIVANCITLPGILICWIGYDLPKGVLMFAVLLIAAQSVPIYTAYHVAAANTEGHTKKQSVNAIVFLMAALGNIAGSYINSSTPGPRYTGEWTGFTCSISVVIIACCTSWWWLSRVNKRKDHMYGPPCTSNTMENVTDKKNSDFRYIY